MTTRIRNFFLGALALFVVAPVTASAAGIDTNAVGLRGYDPVAYFNEGVPTQGENGHVAIYDDVVYLFSSDANKVAFEADPTAFLPQYGGYCAMGVALGKKIPIDPEAWKIVDGKLYLNVSKQVAKHWSKDIPGNITKADNNWPGIKDVSPADL